MSVEIATSAQSILPTVDDGLTASTTWGDMMTSLADGRVLQTFIVTDATGNEQLRGRMFTPDATDAAASFLIAETQPPHSLKSESSVIALPGGGFTVAWAELPQQQTTDQTGTVGFFMRSFDSQGTPAAAFRLGPDEGTPPVRNMGSGIGSNFQNDQSDHLAMTALGDGKVAVAWSMTMPAGWASDEPELATYARILNADGSPASGDILVDHSPIPFAESGSTSASPPVNLGQISLRATESGGFAVTYEAPMVAGGQIAEHVQQSFYDGDGNALGAERDLSAVFTSNDLPFHSGDVHNIELANGDILTVWSEAPTVPFSRPYSRVLISDENNIIKNAITIGYDAKIAALDDGGFLVSYKSGVSGDGLLQKYDGTGQAVSDPVPMYHGSPSSLVNGGFTQLSDGNYVLAYFVQPLGDWGSVRAQLFDPDGNAMSDAVIIADRVVNTFDTIDVTNLTGGRFSISWAGGPSDATVMGENAVVIDTQVYQGSSGNDVWNGTVFADIAHGGDGNDTLTGNGGNDQLYGDAGSDILHAQDGNDFLDGGDGDDTIAAAGGNDIVHGGAGNDVLHGDAGNDELVGGTGNDLIEGGAGADHFVFAPGFGHDVIADFEVDDGAGSHDVIDVSAISLDYDAIIAVAEQVGADVVFTADADNTLTLKNVNLSDLSAEHLGFELARTFQGTTWDDTIDGTAGNDEIFGASGNDVLNGAGGNDRIFGENGRDQLSGGDGHDFLSGGAGADTIWGDAGNDTLWGGDQDDTLHGGSGDDRLAGDKGNDLLYGEAGNDIFVFAPGSQQDTIQDFQFHDADTGRDVIDLTAFDVTFDEILNIAEDGAGEVVIRMNDDDSLTVTGLQRADFTPELFVLG